MLTASHLFAGLHPVSTQSGKCGRVQFCTRFRVLPAQVSHLLGIRNVGAEPLRLSKAEQIFAPTSQIHQADTPASAHRVTKIEGKLKVSRENVRILRRAFFVAPDDRR